MKKLLVLGSMLSALILTGAGCSMGNAPVAPQANSPAASPSATTLPASQPTASQPTIPPQAASAQITIANFAFAPASITVKPGTVVKWTNDDQVVHRIKSDNSAFPDSANLNTADSYQFKFDKPGTYNYSCAIHPSMRGQIIVQ